MILKYTVSFINELDAFREKSESGLISGKDEHDCFDTLKTYYGAENICKFGFEYVADNYCDNILPKDELKTIIENI